MSFLAVGVSAAGIAASLTMAATSQPTYEKGNTTASSKALSDTNAAMLPLQRGLTAAAQSGGSYTFSAAPDLAAAMNIAETGGGWYDAAGNPVQQTAVDPLEGLTWKTGPQGKGFYGQDGAFVSKDPAYGTKTPAKTGPPAGATYKAGQLTMNGVPVTRNPDGTYTVSFKGMSQIDAQKAIADAQAKSGLELSKEFDPQYIQTALEQEKLADPESFAARAEEAKLIAQKAANPPSLPESEMLNQQVQDTLNAANRNELTATDSARLDDAVREALAARGGASGTQGNYQKPLTSGFAGEARRTAAAQGANAFLASGNTPEDTSYKWGQQLIADQSALVNGKTPQSQFSSLSGAQNGPTPQATAAPLPVMPQGQDAAAAGTALQTAGATNQYNSSQVNPWMQGLSSTISGMSIAGSAGWRPFK